MPTATEWTTAGVVALANKETTRQQLIALIKAKREAIGRDERREEIRHTMALDAIKALYRELYDNCPHDETGYQSDPSGGSDSCTWCKLCGAEQDRRGKWV